MMEHRKFGNAGLYVPVLSLGTGTFGGTNDFFNKWGTTGVREATRLVDIALDHGMNFFDTADVYSDGAAEQILGAAIAGKRDQVIISTKVSFRTGEGPNDRGASRFHILRGVEASLKRLGTDYIDIYFIHGYDSTTSLEETLGALGDLVRSGKVRYIACSNFTAWQLQKAWSLSAQLRLPEFAGYQGYYSIIGRDFEYELQPALEDHGSAMMVWSPLGWGRLTGKITRGTKATEGRIAAGGDVNGPMVDDEKLFTVVDVLQEISRETARSVPQIAINWLLQKKTVCNVVIGARNESQLIDNLGAECWALDPTHLSRIDEASAMPALYPHWVGAR